MWLQHPFFKADSANYTLSREVFDMDFWEFLVALALAVAGGATGAAVINGLNDRWKFKATRKAEKEDRDEKREDRTEEIGEEIKELKETEGEWREEVEKRLTALRSQNTVENEALRVILLDRIRHLGQSYIQRGEISFDDRRIFHMMHDVYHNGLGGNGDADLIVEAVDELPLKP